MLILGLDPATRCGWAVLEGEHRVASGTWDLSTQRHEGAGMRYLRARRKLEGLLDAWKVDAVAYEEVRRHAGTSAAHVYGGLVAVIASVCEERGVPYRTVPVGRVKQLATGKGNAGKDEMLAAARTRWAVEVGDDNEADALWIALALAHELKGDGCS